MHASADASCVQGTGLVLPNWFVLGVTVGTHAALTQQQLSSLCKGLYVKRCNFYCHARAVAAGAAQTACPVETTLASRFDSVLTCSPLTRHPYTGNLHSETPGDSKRCVSTQWRCFERHSCQQTEHFFYRQVRPAASTVLEKKVSREEYSLAGSSPCRSALLFFSSPATVAKHSTATVLSSRPHMLPALNQTLTHPFNHQQPHMLPALKQTFIHPFSHVSNHASISRSHMFVITQASKQKFNLHPSIQSC